jgi:hypothetical protein
VFIEEHRENLEVNKNTNDDPILLLQMFTTYVNRKILISNFASQRARIMIFKLKKSIKLIFKFKENVSFKLLTVEHQSQIPPITYSLH